VVDSIESSRTISRRRLGCAIYRTLNLELQTEVGEFMRRAPAGVCGQIALMTTATDVDEFAHSVFAQDTWLSIVLF